MLSVFKKALVASVAIAGLATISQAAATVNYILQYNDNGTNTYTAPSGSTGSYAVYITDSTEAGNYGLQTVTLALSNMTTITNMMPQATYGSVTAGFAFQRSADNDFVNSLSAFVNTTATHFEIQGFGQTAGSFPASVNGNSATNVTSPSWGGGFSDGTSPMLLATGTYNTGTPLVMDMLGSDAWYFTGPFTAGVGNSSSILEADNFETTVRTLSPAGTDVPEPASLGVLALGGLALLARRRKVA